MVLVIDIANNHRPIAIFPRQTCSDFAMKPRPTLAKKDSNVPIFARVSKVVSFNEGSVKLKKKHHKNCHKITVYSDLIFQMIVVSGGTDVLILFRTHSNPDLSKKEISIPNESNQIVSESIETNETLDTEGHKDITVLVSDKTKAC